jgi:Cysteinyl-tRNA synthetase
MRDIYLTNTLSRNKELFVPVEPGHMGIYVCGLPFMATLISAMPVRA